MRTKREAMIDNGNLTEIEKKMLEMLKIKDLKWSEPGPYDTQALNRLIKKGYAEKVMLSPIYGGFKWRLKGNP
jgi:hypothetical protein